MMRHVICLLGTVTAFATPGRWPARPFAVRLLISDIVGVADGRRHHWSGCRHWRLRLDRTGPVLQAVIFPGQIAAICALNKQPVVRRWRQLLPELERVLLPEHFRNACT